MYLLLPLPFLLNKKQYDDGALYPYSEYLSGEQLDELSSDENDQDIDWDAPRHSSVVSMISSFGHLAISSGKTECLLWNLKDSIEKESKKVDTKSAFLCVCQYLCENINAFSWSFFLACAYDSDNIPTPSVCSGRPPKCEVFQLGQVVPCDFLRGK